MTRVTVLAAFGASAINLDEDSWTDITGWVDIVSSGISTTRGASDELQQTQTGTCSLTLDNTDGRFTPGSASSPYYPYMRRRLPVWVGLTTLSGINFVTNPTFEAGTAGWSAPFADSVAGYGTDTAHAHSGTKSMLVQWVATGTGGQVRTRVCGLTIGRTYTASAYVWVPASNPAVRLRIDGTTLGALSGVTGAFTRITVSWTATAGSHLVQFTTGTTSPAPGTSAWIDDVQVEEAASASAFDSQPATVHDRFYGAVTSLPFGWKGLQATVQITCSDLFAWLARDPALQPMLVEETMLTEPVAYYLLSEAEGATAGGDISGQARPALTATQVGVGGTLTFGTGTGPSTDGLSTPVFAPASSTAGLCLTMDAVQPLTDAATRPGTYTFECWFSTTVKGRVIMAWQGNDPITFDNSIVFLLDATTGALVIETRDAGALTTTTVATGNLANGAVHHLVYDDRQGALGTDQYTMVDGTVRSVVISPQRDQLRRLTVGAYNSARLWDGSISHVAVYLHNSNPRIPQSSFTAHYTAGTTAFAGESADTRMARLLTYTGIYSLITAGAFSAVAAQGELGQNVLAHMREVEATESGKVVCSRGSTSSGSIVFQSRTVRYNPMPALTLAWSDTETDDGAWADDDQKLINTVTASRPNGAVQVITDAASIAAYGPYEPTTGTTLLKVSDAEVIDAATWLVSRYADPPPELRQLEVDAYSMPTATYAALLEADVSTVIALTGLPSQAPAATTTVFVEGYTETITQAGHKLTFHTSAAATDTVWVLDDLTYSVLGSTTRLAY